MNYGMRFMTLYRRQGSRPSPQKRNAKNKMAALQIAVKRREAKSRVRKKMHWSQQTPSSNNTREDFTHGHHQMVNTKIRLVIFFAAKDGEALTASKKKTGS